MSSALLSLSALIIFITALEATSKQKRRRLQLLNEIKRDKEDERTRASEQLNTIVLQNNHVSGAAATQRIAHRTHSITATNRHGKEE
jgi:hypothetical protein